MWAAEAEQGPSSIWLGWLRYSWWTPSSLSLVSTRRLTKRKASVSCCLPLIMPFSLMEVFPSRLALQRSLAVSPFPPQATQLHGQELPSGNPLGYIDSIKFPFFLALCPDLVPAHPSSHSSIHLSTHIPIHPFSHLPIISIHSFTRLSIVSTLLSSSIYKRVHY